MKKDRKKKTRLLKWILCISILAVMLGGCGAQEVQQNTDKDNANPGVSQVADSSSEETETAKGTLNVHFLDVGQGLAVLAESDGHYMLYDGGDRSTSSFVVSYLKKQGVKQLDYVFVSHYDADHLSGVLGAMEIFPVERIIAPDYEHESKLYQSFVNAVKNSGKVVEHPERGAQYVLGSAGITVMAPKEISEDANENSVVVKLVQGETSFLLTGDAERNSEAEMCASGMDLETTVLSLGHHGSANSTSWEFLQAVVPEYAVISCKTGNQYGHPAADIMEKLENMEIEVLRTDKQGTIVASVKDGVIRWNVEPCNDYTPGDPDDVGTQPGGDFDFAEEATPEEETGSGEEADENGQEVWLSATGEKYHSIPDCGRMNPDKARKITRKEAQAQGYEACDKCY